MDDPSRPGPSAGGGAPPPGKGDQQGGQRQGNGQGANHQNVVDLFGSDAMAAGFILVLLLLGLMRAAMTPCVCLQLGN